jgi:hypothetical protein
MNFLCRPCKELLCEDCSSIADEYETLLTNWKRANSALEYENQGLRQLLEKAAYYVDSMTCPSVKRENEKWTHSELCQKISSTLGIER